MAQQHPSLAGSPARTEESTRMLKDVHASAGSSTEDTASRTASSTEHDDSEPSNQALKSAAESKDRADVAGTDKEATAGHHPTVGSIRLVEHGAADDDDSDLTFAEAKVPENVEGTHSCGSSLTEDNDDDGENEEDVAEQVDDASDCKEMAAGSSSRPVKSNEVEEVLEVQAPAGMLGIVIDTPPGMPAPIVHAVKESSILSGFVAEGDALIAIDDDDVRHMPASEISALIASRSTHPTRKLTIVRVTALAEEHHAKVLDVNPVQQESAIDEFSPLNNQNRLLLDAALALTKEGAGDDELILCALSQSLSALSTSVSDDAADGRGSSSRLPVVSPTRSVKSIGNAEEIVLTMSELPYMDSPLENLGQVQELEHVQELEPVQEVDERSEALLEVLTVETEPLRLGMAVSTPVPDEVEAAGPHNPEDRSDEFRRKSFDKLPSFIHISLGEPCPEGPLDEGGEELEAKAKATRKKHKRRKKRRFAKERIEL